MGTHRTLVSLTVLIVLGLYVFLFELRDKTQDLHEYSRRDVNRLVLTYRDQRIEVSREPSGDWRLIHPLQVSADASTIEAILSTLRQSKIKSVLEEDPSEGYLKSFGLRQPWASLAMITSSGEPLPPILVGEMSPLGDQAYVRRGDYSAVLLTGAGLKTTLEKTVADFRDKRILRFNR